ncbi:hypothetical protein E7681_02130 [Thalassobius vesicularis]|uniref:Uncharacterized protein n=1 Tax=Thalassobius vesicularis TaxID=1294297 RepID=A0A4S3MCU7_9RHOB|nr:hypothetical protein [Thalassobius vesicularis]THD76661.1 hypothetical protein E7681_02130 [Thalassobius vesicularis]
MPDYAQMLAQLDAGTLDPSTFSHTAHIGITVQALTEGDFYTAHARIARGLQRLTTAAGAPKKFNATLTFAWLSEIARRYVPDQTPNDFLRALPELAQLDLRQIYPADLIQSELARRVPLLPVQTEP